MSENALDTLVNEIGTLLKPIENVSGTVFYTGRQALEGKSDFYLIGLNPGGNPCCSEECTIKESLAHWQERKSDTAWSAYCDEYWGQKKPWSKTDHGNSRHQRGVRIFCKDFLGKEVRNVFAANLVFQRSIRGDHLPKDTSVDHICWQVHQLLFLKVQPKYIICLGHGPGSSFDRLKSGKYLAVDGPCGTAAFKTPNGKKNCYLRWFEAAQIRNSSPGLERLVRVIGVPHPSWFALGASWFSEAWKTLPLLDANPPKCLSV